MDIQYIISRLEGARRTGEGRYIARCPAHADKSPSLAVTQKDSVILIHCFGGCTTADVLAAIGFELKDLFPERPVLSKRHNCKFSAYDVLQCLHTEALIVKLAAHDCKNHIPMSDKSLARVELAYDRLEDACRVVFGGQRHV
jgi:hypothetical protein